MFLTVRETLIEPKTDSIQFQFEQQLAWKLVEMKPNLIGGITASAVKDVALQVVKSDFPGNEILSAMKFSRNWIERFMKDNDLGKRLKIFELGKFLKYGASSEFSRILSAVFFLNLIFRKSSGFTWIRFSEDNVLLCGATMIEE